MSEESPREQDADAAGDDRRDPAGAPRRSSAEPLPGDDPPEEPIHES